MTQVRIEENATKKHAPLVQMASSALENLPSEGCVRLGDAGGNWADRRKGDRIVALQQSDTPAIARMGAGSATVAYNNDSVTAARAAIVAAGAVPGTPVCADPASLALLTLAQRVAVSEIPVLIDGPTGTGKEVLARFIHVNSMRKDGPFVAINCAAMPEAMLEAMLFGHLKGAFTGAAQNSEGFFRAADGGTLLLDEIAEMPIGLQAKLLRVLQEGEVVPIGATMPIPVDVRIVACANRDLPAEVAAGRLRADLYYRLNVFPLNLAPLHDRKGDIAPLAFAMLLRHGNPTGDLPWITNSALAKLDAHIWPGNIRELENVMRRAMLLCCGGVAIDDDHIVFDASARVVANAGGGAPLANDATSPAVAAPNGQSLSRIGRKSEHDAIIATLKECGGHRQRTARRLGISERTLRYRMATMRDAGLIDQPRISAGAVR